jgi:hypothetical protein
VLCSLRGKVHIDISFLKPRGDHNKHLVSL